MYKEDQIEIGDWVCYQVDGCLVHSKIEYKLPNSGYFPYYAVYMTLKGVVGINEILEVRRNVLPCL